MARNDLDLSSIMIAYNRARGAAHRGVLDPKRVNRALGIVMARPGEQRYVTTLNYCNCPDNFRQDVVCKHRIALMIETRAGEIHHKKEQEALAEAVYLTQFMERFLG